MTDLTKLVRKLEWREETKHFAGRNWTSDTRFGEYYIFQDDMDDLFRWGNLVTLCEPSQEETVRAEFSNLEAAQAAANADHAARVVAALDAELLAEVVGLWRGGISQDAPTAVATARQQTRLLAYACRNRPAPSWPSWGRCDGKIRNTYTPSSYAQIWFVAGLDGIRATSKSWRRKPA